MAKYTLDELKSLKKAEIVDLLKKEGIEFDPSQTAVALRGLLLDEPAEEAAAVEEPTVVEESVSEPVEEAAPVEEPQAEVAPLEKPEVVDVKAAKEAAAEKAARESTARQKELAAKKKLWEKYDKAQSPKPRK